jgi:hypothetical protein
VPAQPVFDVAVFGDELRIIEENEIVMRRRPINGECHQSQGQPDQPLPARFHRLIEFESVRKNNGKVSHGVF